MHNGTFTTCSGPDCVQDKILQNIVLHNWTYFIIEDHTYFLSPNLHM
jgi:hypothetical protein